jgi:drug/metabolite transporter (DMT)-like permease
MTIFWVIALTLWTVLGDFFIKKASMMPKFSGWYFLLVGCFIWASTAVGWFFILRKMELSNVNAIYSVATVIFVLALSYFYFHEKISFAEVIGFILAVASIYLLARFA